MTREGLIKKAAGAIRAAWSDKANPTDFDLAIATLSAIEAAGVRLVPEFSTFEMESAVKDEHIPHRDIYGHLSLNRRREGASDIYRAMLAASPYAPAQKDESHE